MKKTICALSRLALLFFIFNFPGHAYHEITGGPVVVNGVELNSEQGAAIIQFYGAIPAGHYWYDSVSGLWGLEGGPGTGQIMPNLPIGGPLRENASGGGTGVFVNGREIHVQEYIQLLQLYGSVVPGRYWMNAQFIGGYEGGPAIFDLGAAAGSNSQGSGYNQNTIGGGLMSDGSCSGYLHPGGASVMTGNC